MANDIQFRMRVRRGETIAVGPGKISLLEAIAEMGSISAAARELGMSYRRAWLLIDELNHALREPAVVTAAGGSRGGGAILTETGTRVVGLYRAIETSAHKAAKADIAALKRLIRD